MAEGRSEGAEVGHLGAGSGQAKDRRTRFAQREKFAAERKSFASGNAERQPSPEASRPIAGGRAPHELTESSRKTRGREHHRIRSHQRKHPGRDAGFDATNPGTPRTPTRVRFSFARFPV